MLSIEDPEHAIPVLTRSLINELCRNVDGAEALADQGVVCFIREVFEKSMQRRPLLPLGPWLEYSVRYEAGTKSYRVEIAKNFKKIAEAR